MPPAARMTDFIACPMVTPGVPPVPHAGGTIIGVCSPNVIIGGQPAARVSDFSLCVPAIPNPIPKGSATVMINSLPAARIGDMATHGGAVASGFPTVVIGDSSNAGGGGGGPGGPAGGGGEARGDGRTREEKGDVGSLSAGPALADPAAQVLALKAASKSGAAFIEICRGKPKGKSGNRST